MSIRIIEIFVRLRERVLTYKDILLKLEQIERKAVKQDDDIKLIFEYLRELLNPPVIAGQQFFLNDFEITKLTTNAIPEYQYNLKDHLGNVRLTFTTKDDIETTTATLETANLNLEQSQFLRINTAKRVNSSIFDRTNGSAPTTTLGHAQRLNGSGKEKYGVAKSISVMPGDVINAEVYAKYVDPVTSNWTGAFNTLIGQIAANTAGVVIDGAAYINSTSTFPLGYGVVKGTDTGGPKAYLNWLIFDRNFGLITGGFKQMGNTAKEAGTDVPHERVFNTDPILITQPGYVYIYLSNESPTTVEVYFDDFKVTQIKSPVIQSDSYYPFGLTFNSYQRENSTPNQFLYNGKELQEETGWLDYGARMYMPELGRWTSVDILADAYVDFSPYAYVLNNPLKFVDPDGKKVLYVNGYWQDTWLGKNVIGSSKPGRGYWGNGFVRGASKFFNDGQRGNGMFIDGSSQWGGDESGSERYTRGYEYAKKHYDELIADMRQDETFKLVTHSEGGAYGAGIAQYLIDQGKTVETILHLSTDEADEFDNPENTTTYQLGYGGDWVTGNKEVSNADVFGVVDKFSSNSDKAKYAHGSTKGGGVFKSVNALLKAAASGATGVNVTETSSGVRFEFIRKKEDEDKNK